MSIDKEADYWDAGGIETIDIMRAKLTTEQFRGFLLGSLMKYPLRSNFKGCFRRDIEKSGVYNKLLLELPEEIKCTKCGSFNFHSCYLHCPYCGKKLEKTFYKKETNKNMKNTINSLYQY